MNGSPPDQRRQVLVNTLVSVLANGWMILLTIVALPLLLAGLGVDSFGTWALLLTFSATNGWLSLADLGLGIATVRATAHHLSDENPQGAATVFGTALAMYLGLGLICAVLFEIVAPLVLPSLFSTPSDLLSALDTAIAFFGIQILLDLLAVGLMAVLEGGQRLDLARGVDTTNRTLTAVATVTVATLGGGLAGVAAASMVASAVTLVVAVMLARRAVRTRPRVAWHEARALVGYGLQIGVLRSAGVLHRTMDRLIVGALLGPAAVAIVEIATQVQNGVAALLSATTQAVTAGASWLRARSALERLRELLLRGTKYSTLVVLPVTALVAALASPIIGLWVGAEYDEAVIPLVLAMAYLASQTPVQVGSNLLQGSGHVRGVLWPAVAGVVVNLAASIVLVESIGVTGAFVGTLIGGAVLTPALLRNVLHHTGLRGSRFARVAVRPALLPALGAGSSAGIVALLPWGDLATVVVGSLVGLTIAMGVGVGWSTTASERHDVAGSLLRTPPA